MLTLKIIWLLVTVFMYFIYFKRCYEIGESINFFVNVGAGIAVTLVISSIFSIIILCDWIVKYLT